jgi:glycosyltransferase involved in cell wall biosynthesis
MADMLDALPDEARPTPITPWAGAEFEFGTEYYRARVYARSVEASVPPGTPIIASDDPAAWRAAAMLADRHPFVAVLHADDVAYYGYARRHAMAVSAWVCVSSRVGTGLRALHLSSDAPVATIACGVPMRPFRPRAEAEAPAARLVWIGRVEERQKRVSDLPRIAAELRRIGVRFSLDILGDGDALAPLQAQIREARLTDVMRLHGWCDAARVAEVLAASDVLLLPSNFEGMPVAAMEAMAAGCGVVASRVSGFEDYEGAPGARECLWLHNVGDIAAAAAAVRAACEVEPARRAVAARELAEREFAIERCVERYDRLLAGLPATTGRKARRPLLGGVGTLWSHAVAASRVARIRLRDRSKRGGADAGRPDGSPRVEVSHAGA